MKYCPNCGCEAENDAAFCGNCGTPIPTETVSEETVPVIFAFCPECGEKLERDDAFCPNCGTALEKTKIRQKKENKMVTYITGNRNKLTGIAVAVIAVIVVLAVASKLFSAVFVSPAKQFCSYQRKALTDPVLDWMEEKIDKAGSGKFSTDLLITASVDQPLVDGILSDLSAGLKVDVNRDRFLLNGELTYQDDPLLSGILSFDKGNVGICFPELDDTYYTMDISRVLSELSGQEIDLSVLKIPEISGKEWRSAAESYLNLLYGMVTKEKLEVEKNKTFRLEHLKGRLKGTVYTYTPDSQDIENLMYDLADMLEGDRELRRLILETAGVDMMESVLGESEFSAGTFEEDLEEELCDLADYLRKCAELTGHNLENAGSTWILCMEGREIRKAEISLAGQSAVICYETKGTESKEREELLYIKYYGKEISVVNSYSKKGEIYTGNMALTTPYGEQCRLEYETKNKEKSALGIPYGTYDLSVEDAGLRVSLDVEKEEKGSADHNLIIRTDYNELFGMFDKLELNINATQKGSPGLPKEKFEVDISDYEREEYIELLEELSDALHMELNDELGIPYYGW